MGDNVGDLAVVTAGEFAAVLQAMDEKYRMRFDTLRRQGGGTRIEPEIKEEIILYRCLM